MTTTDEIAEFVRNVEYDDLSGEVREELKKRVLDSVGIAIGAMGEEAPGIVLATVREASSEGTSRLWGTEETASIPEATMYNTSLTRYLDYMDSFLAPGETPHPSDNIAAILACGEAEGASGRELIEAIGIAYESQGELVTLASGTHANPDDNTYVVLDGEGLDPEGGTLTITQADGESFGSLEYDADPNAEPAVEEGSESRENNGDE